jgi:hypothetical protein
MRGKRPGPVLAREPIVKELIEAIDRSPHVTRAALCRKIDLTPNQVTLWARGDVSPNLRQLRRLAEVAGYRLALVRQ